MNRWSIVGRIRQSLYRLFKKDFPAKPIEVERSEMMFYINYLREGMVVFDVGANIGELSLLFSRFVGSQGRVYAFEASSAVFKHLSIMCGLSGRKNIILNHRALTDREGYIKLYVYNDTYSGWNSLTKRPLHTYGIHIDPVGTEKVLATTVDAHCEKNGVKRIDLLKIDVEGAEYQVLLGARRMLQEKRIACCVFEFGATTFDMCNDPSDIESYLGECGYEIRNIVRGDPVFPGRSHAKSAHFSVHVAWPKI